MSSHLSSCPVLYCLQHNFPLFPVSVVLTPASVCVSRAGTSWNKKWEPWALRADCLLDKHYFHPWSFHPRYTLSSQSKTRRSWGCDGWIVRKTSVGCLPANTVESNQAKQVCKADPRSLKRKGCKQMKYLERMAIKYRCLQCICTYLMWLIARF